MQTLALNQDSSIDLILCRVLSLVRTRHGVNLLPKVSHAPAPPRYPHKRISGKAA